jgi:hypothetical protein
MQPHQSSSWGGPSRSPSLPAYALLAFPRIWRAIVNHGLFTIGPGRTDAAADRAGGGPSLRVRPGPMVIKP